MSQSDSLGATPAPAVPLSVLMRADGLSAAPHDGAQAPLLATAMQADGLSLAV